jgi:tetratricopeptide (TPR) repeat protein
MTRKPSPSRRGVARALLAGLLAAAASQAPGPGAAWAQTAQGEQAQAGEAQGAKQPIRVRGGNHGDYGRMVFDWPESVQYEVERFDNTLYISFARRADFEFFSVFPALDGYVGQPAPGPHGYRLTVPMKDDFAVKDWTYGTKVVIDLKRIAKPETPGTPPRVRVRAQEQPERAVLTFHWPFPVGYDLQQDSKAGTASLRFRRAARFDFSDYRADQPSQVLNLAPVVSARESGVDLRVPKDARLRVSDDGTAVELVIDATARGRTAAAEGAGPVSAQQPDRLGPAGTDTPAGSPSPAPEAVETAELPAEPADPEPDGPGAQGEAAGTDGGGDDAPLALLPKVKPALRAAQVAQDVLAGARRFTPEKIAQGIVPAPGEVPPPVDQARVEMPWAGRAAAAFARAGAQWLAVSGRAPEDFAEELKAAVADLQEVARQDFGDATLVRLTGGPDFRARPELDAGLWRAVLSRQPALPALPIDVRLDAGRVVMPVEASGPAIPLSDPATGRPLTIVPVAAPGQGVAVARDFPEFTLLATHTGIAVLAKADYVKVTRSQGEVAVEGDGRELMISPDGSGPVRQARSAATDGESLLDLEAWRQPGRSFVEAKQQLRRRISDAAPADKPMARLDLARFHFAHGMAVEALGQLDLYAKNAPRRAQDPQVLLMRGASQLLAGNWNDAAATLNDPALDGVAAALPWQAAYAALTGAHEAAAAAFHKAEAMLAAYPPSVRKQLRLWAAHARIEIGDLAGAEVDLDKVRELSPTRAEAAQLAFLEGRRQLVAGEPEAAEERWREAAASSHPPSRTRARFVLTERDLAAGEIDAGDAIAELERLRYAWRGDEFEAVLLHRLADLYIEEARYGRALAALKQAASHLPDSPLAERATARMRRLFTRLFLDGEADRMPALKALALYESFRELTPAGDRGDEMIGRLADRLVGVDLLTRAGSLLESQVRRRLSGVEKADVGTRLAAIRLLDRKPEAALEALDISRVEGIAPALEAKRRLLRARALAGAGQPDAALGLLAGVSSEPALELAADIHSEQGNWPRAVAVLERMLPEMGDDGRLPPQDAARVMRTAVAMTLAGQGERLRALSATYGPAMAASAHAQTFDLLDPSTGGGPVTVAKQLAEVQTAKSFMDTFRSRLEDASTRPTGDSAAQP